MRPHGSGDRSGDERHGPGTDRGAEEQVDARLRAMWQELFDREAPVLGRRYLEDRLAFRLQELHFGGLSDRARRKLDALADQLEPKAARRRDPDRPLARHRASRASGRASSTSSGFASTTSNIMDAHTDPFPRSREQIAGIAMERLAVLWPSSQWDGQMISPARKFRCAIYCRKSSEEGLEPSLQFVRRAARSLPRLYREPAARRLDRRRRPLR